MPFDYHTERQINWACDTRRVCTYYIHLLDNLVPLQFHITSSQRVVESCANTIRDGHDKLTMVWFARMHGWRSTCTSVTAVSRNEADGSRVRIFHSVDTSLPGVGGASSY